MPLNLEKIYTDAVSWVVVTLIGGMVTWVAALRRKVNTNEAQLKQDRLSHMSQIELIMAELRNREKMREEDRERMERVEGDVRDIKNALLGKSC